MQLCKVVSISVSVTTQPKNGQSSCAHQALFLMRCIPEHAIILTLLETRLVIMVSVTEYEPHYDKTFLAHLSRRLKGELIGYSWSGVRRRCRRRCCPPFSNVSSSGTAWPIKAKFYVEPPWEGGTKVYINGPGHMTKMAAMPIYGKKT